MYPPLVFVRSALFVSCLLLHSWSFAQDMWQESQPQNSAAIHIPAQPGASGAQGAYPESFEQQVLQISQEVSGAAQQTRQALEASQAQAAAAQNSAVNRADAFDETKVGVAAKFIPIKPGI